MFVSSIKQSRFFFLVAFTIAFVKVSYISGLNCHKVSRVTQMLMYFQRKWDHALLMISLIWIWLIFRNYYFYEFGNNIQHVALLAAVNSGKVHISTLFVDFEYIYCSANMLLDVILVEHVRVERSRIKLQFK